MLNPSLRTLCLGLFILLLLPTSATAQITTESATQSLAGIRGFYVRIDLEGSMGLTRDEELNLSTLNERVKSRLRNAGLNVLEPNEVNQGITEPYLYLHINMMDTDHGFIPFAINTQFYQRVERKTTRPKQSLVAATWEEGLLGLAPQNQLSFITDSAVESLSLFIDDYFQTNPQP